MDGILNNLWISQHIISLNIKGENYFTVINFFTVKKLLLKLKALSSKHPAIYNT